MKTIKKIFCLITAVIIFVGFDSLHIYAASMSTSESGLSLIKGFEGCRLTAYKALSTETYYTIGYGHYGPDVYAGMTITQSQAEEMLHNDLKKYEGYVNTFLNNNGISVTQNQFDALVSFTYNLGNVWVSTPTFLLKTYLINGVGNYTSEQITTAFTNWCKSGGNVIQGLLTRRKKEAEYFLQGIVPPPPPPVVDNSYDVPWSGQPKATSGKITVYNVNGVPYSLSEHYIAHDDNCTVHEVYNNGLCKVTYPTSNGTRTEYAKADEFPIPKKADPINQTVDTSYQTPCECEPIATSGLITVYNVYGVPYSTTVRNIAHDDWCTIHEVYTSGYCLVEYPVPGGTHTEYAKTSDFDIPIISKISSINLHVWIGDTETGHCPSEYVYGNRYYLCYELTDSNTGKKINDISNLNYKVTETFKKPDGSTFEYSYDNSDGNWISTVAEHEGTYEGIVSVTGDFSVECGVSFDIHHEHQYTAKVIAPTFTEQGYTLYTCSVCGESYKDNYTEMKIKGDINNDSSVGVSDVVILQKYLVKKENLTNWQAADMNSDGQVNVFDVVILKRRILRG